MGGTQFWRFLRDLAPAAFQRDRGLLLQRPTDHMLVDLSLLVHRSMRSDLMDEKHLSNSVVAGLRSVVRSYMPTESFFVALDGSAPLAKLPLQIQRRSKYFDENRKLISPPEAAKTIHRLELSPGSAYYSRLETLLSKTFTPGDQATSWKEIPYKQFLLNASSNPGEGESKIMKHILELRAADLLAHSSEAKTYSVLSGDSDTVLQLFTSTPDINCIMQGGWWGNLLSFEAVRNELANTQASTIDINRTLQDLAFMTLLTGSDYLPSIAHLSLARLFETYRSQLDDRHATSDVDATNDGYLVRITQQGVVFDLQALLYALQPSLCGQPPSSFEIKGERTGNELKQVKEHFKGLLWSLGMFSKGECLDYSYIPQETSDMELQSLSQGLVEWIQESGTHYESEWPLTLNNAATAQEATLRIRVPKEEWNRN
ncbi:hypothetical protein BSLG_009724 [Batrachochytrium salamandrivorans]|nr:hypothetical protein BSLG_009724 [Batrachochytrium salamandrivorans]